MGTEVWDLDWFFEKSFLNLMYKKRAEIWKTFYSSQNSSIAEIQKLLYPEWEVYCIREHLSLSLMTFSQLWQQCDPGETVVVGSKFWSLDKVFQCIEGSMMFSNTSRLHVPSRWHSHTPYNWAWGADDTMQLSGVYVFWSTDLKLISLIWTQIKSVNFWLISTGSQGFTSPGFPNHNA